MSTSIDRIKAKALAARDIVPTALKNFEADLDEIIAAGPVLDQNRNEAVSLHREGTSGLLSEIDGLKSAMAILSNGGGDPLEASGGLRNEPLVDYLARNKITLEEHNAAIAAGHKPESRYYFEYIEKLKAGGK